MSSTQAPANPGEQYLHGICSIREDHKTLDLGGGKSTNSEGFYGETLQNPSPLMAWLP
jgi:hypothetical protein